LIRTLLPVETQQRATSIQQPSAFALPMPPFTRILSDIHYGDRASRVRVLGQIAPLLDGPARIVMNGDTLDTRMGSHPGRTAELLGSVREFFTHRSPPAELITGNHDTDISDTHALELAGGRVFVTHGDVLFEDIVPWGRDAPLIRRLIAEENAKLTAAERAVLETQLAVIRRVAARLPQRHQVEPEFWKYVRSFLADTLWPPDRALRILRTWRDAPGRAAALLRTHRPRAGFIVIGHFHRPGVWQTADGRVVINTGSFCPPLGGAVVDVSADRLVVRKVREVRGEFRVDGVLAEFPIAEVGPPGRGAR
jgi:predicted phosphodiesterase